MSIFYKQQPDGSIDSVELPDSEQARALASGYSLTKPAPVIKPADLPAKTPPDAVNTDYFNNLLDVTERDYGQQRNAAQGSHDLLVNQIKQGTELFNKGLENEYGKALENLNIDVYNRGVANSGITGRATTDLGKNKEASVQERAINDAEKQQIADQDLRNKLDNINLGEQKSKLTISRQASSPYTNYSYTP